MNASFVQKWILLSYSVFYNSVYQLPLLPKMNSVESVPESQRPNLNKDVPAENGQEKVFNPDVTQIVSMDELGKTEINKFVF